MLHCCLIQPPNRVLATPTMYFPLSLLYLARSLKRAGLSVAVADLRAREATLDALRRIPEARVYGITFTTGESADAYRLAEMLRADRPNAMLVAGGAHPSLVPDDSRLALFHYVVRGEGERAIVTICEGAIPPGRVNQTPIYDLDSLGFPDRDAACFSDTLWPGEKYGTDGKATTLMWSRGCPYRCAFCANLHRLPVRYRSPANVLAEIDLLVARYGCRHFRVEDDNLGLWRDWTAEVCEGLSRRDVHLKGHLRSNLVTEDVALMLSEAHFEEVGLGVESADDRVLKLVGKGETAADHYRAVGALKRHGIRAKVYWMAGLPGETEETVRLNQEFMRVAQPNRWTVSIFTPYPGSAIGDNPERYGVRVFSRDYSRYWNFDHWNHELDGVRVEDLRRRHDGFKAFCMSEVWKAPRVAVRG